MQNGAEGRPGRTGRVGIRRGLIAVCLASSALALAACGESGSDQSTLEATGNPGRALQGAQAPLESLAAMRAHPNALPERTVSSDPAVLTATKAGSEVFDVRDLHGTVSKKERPEREPPLGFGAGECSDPESGSQCDAGSEAAPEGAAPVGSKRSAASGQSVPAPSAPAPAPDQSFPGLDFANWGAGHPPDTNGDVGPDYFIQTINTAIGIFDKSTGSQVAAFTFNSFMSQGSFGNLCDTDNFGDPVVLYDSLEDRWFISDFAFKLDGSGNVSPQHVFECFAVSKTSDPVNGGWNYYSLEAPGGLADYPKFGVWPDGIYMAANMFAYSASGGYQGPHVWAIDKAQMYAGAPTAQMIDFAAPNDDFTLVPANARLQAGTPPAGRPEYFVSTEEFLNGLTVYKFHVDWERTANSTFTGPDVPLNATSWPNASVPNAATPGNSLDVLQIRAMAQAQYSNIGGAESVWVPHTVRRANTSGFAAPRWYQLDVSGGPVAANTLQGTTWDPDGANVTYRYIPSLAVDHLGDLALGYSTSNSTTDPTIAYAGRLAGDAANTFSQGEQTLIAGTGTQTGNCGGTCTRWGDYSGMALDPDGCQFWETNEYYLTNGLNHQTRIGSFKFPGCTTVGDGTLSGTVTAGGSPVSGATVSLGSRTTSTNPSGNYTFSVPAGVYPSMTASKAGFQSSEATSLTVPDGGGATQDFALASAPLTGCLTDDSQSDFQTGDATGCDLTTGPGSVRLGKDTSGSQSNSTVTSNGFAMNATAWGGQTFVPSKSGTVTDVSLQLFCSGCTGTTPNLTVSIRATTGSPAVPTGPDLATATISGFSSGGAGEYSASFASPPAVTAGTAYAIVIRPNSNPSAGTYAYLCSCSPPSDSNPYANGRRVTSADSGSNWTADTTSGGRDLAFTATVESGFSSQATFTSGVKDANPPAGRTPQWSTLSYTATTPAGTDVKFQIAGSNSSTGPFNYVGPNGTASTFFTTSGADLSQFDGMRYLRYKAILSTTDSAQTPSLNSVALCFADFAAASLSVQPAAGPHDGTASLSATLASGGQPLSGKTIHFSLNGNSVGSAATNATGVATLNNASLAGIATGTYPSGVSASFDGDSTDGGDTSTAQLDVSGAPAISPNPGSWNFGKQRVGTTGTAKSFTITNSGDGPLNPTGVTITGADKADFNKVSESCTAGAVGVGGTCSVAVQFKPGTAGSRTAAIHIVSDDPASPTDIAMIGTGTVPALSIAPASNDFPPQRVGTESATTTFRLSNLGTAPLTVGTLSLAGGDAGQYAISNNACSGHSVDPSQSCTVDVSFKPTGVGAHDDARLHVLSDDPGGAQDVPLRGSGVVPTLSVRPKKGSFGKVAVKGGHVKKKFTITDAGGAPLTISALKLAGAKGQYKAKTRGCTKGLIAPGATCKFKVIFDPTKPGTHKAKVKIKSDGGKAKVKLAGKGKR